MIRMKLSWVEGMVGYTADQLYVDEKAAESSLPDWFEKLGIMGAYVELSDAEGTTVVSKHWVGQKPVEQPEVSPAGTTGSAGGTGKADTWKRESVARKRGRK